jgi:hypothetical protein
MPAATVLSARGQSHGVHSWSSNGQKVEIRYTGEVEFSDDDADVKRMSPGGSIRISDNTWLGGAAAEFRADSQGNITRRYWVGSSEKPYEPEGRAWVAKMLPRFIRQSGMGAPARVARILKAKGPEGVLAEIALIEGSWAKRIYFSEIIKTGSLQPAMVVRVLEQAGREMDSDFELASLLISGADTLLVNDATRQAYFNAARTIGSDFEMRRVYSSALKKGPVSPSLLGSLLDASQGIESDFEAASLLVQVAKQQPLDNQTRRPFFAALATIGSDFEKRRVLSALAEQPDLTEETVVAMLESGSTVDSDFEAASFLVQVAQARPVEGTLRAPFFRAVDSIGSAFERGRVLRAVLKRSDASEATIVAVLRSVGHMSSGHESAQVLLATANAHPLTGEARDVYIDAAGKLGDFEQGRVMSALVRNEKRR